MGGVKRIGGFALIIAVACATCAGCGIAREPGQARSGTPAPPTTATAAGNKSLAIGEARRLVALGPVPAGARSVPVTVAGPAFGRPSVTSLIDQQRQWRLPMTFGQAAAWVKAHPPAGMGGPVASGTRTAAEGGAQVSYAYDAPGTAAWDDAQLQVEVTPDGQGAAFLREDAIVVWLDPDAADNYSGPRIHVSVAGGCPASIQSYLGISNTGADLRSSLLPAAQPVAGLKCVYHGSDGPAFTLRTSTRLSTAQARATAAAMQRLPLAQPIGGTSAGECGAVAPRADSSIAIIVLTYPGRPDVDLGEALNNCGGVANGFILASTPG